MPSSQQNTPTPKPKFSLAPIWIGSGLVLVVGLILGSLFAFRGSTEFSARNFHRFLEVQLSANYNHPQIYNQIKQNVKNAFRQEDGLIYLLVWPREISQEVLALFKKSDPPLNAQTLQEIKSRFKALGTTPKGYFKAYGFDHLYTQLEARNGHKFWIQYGKVPVGNWSTSGQSIAAILALTVGLLLGLLGLVFYIKRGRGNRPRPPLFERVDAPSRPTRPEKPVQAPKSKPIQKKTAPNATEGEVKSKAVASALQHTIDRAASAPAEPLEQSVALYSSEIKLEKNDVQQPSMGTPSEISLSDEMVQPNSELVYWEHQTTLLDFWKKFLHRVSLFSDKDDYIFLFVKKDDYEGISIRSTEELKPVIGLKGAVYVSSEYIEQSRVHEKLHLAPLLRLKGAVSADRSLVQLPLVSNQHVFGALLFYRSSGPVREGQVAQIWNEVSSLSNDLLQIRQYDLALREDLTGLFNRRHFQYSLKQNFKLKESIPSRGLLLLSVSQCNTPGDIDYNDAMKAIGESFRKNAQSDEELFAVKVDGQVVELALIGEAKPLEHLQAFLDKVFTNDPQLAKMEATIIGGYSVLSDGVNSSKRWLEEALIGMQEAEFRGPNTIVQTSYYNKENSLSVQWHSPARLART